MTVIFIDFATALKEIHDYFCCLAVSLQTTTITCVSEIVTLVSS